MPFRMRSIDILVEYLQSPAKVAEHIARTKIVASETERRRWQSRPANPIWPFANKCATHTAGDQCVSSRPRWKPARSRGFSRSTPRRRPAHRDLSAVSALPSARVAPSFGLSRRRANSASSGRASTRAHVLSIASFLAVFAGRNSASLRSPSFGSGGVSGPESSGVPPLILATI